MLAIAAFAQAECALAEPQKSGSSGFVLTLDSASLSGQLDMQVYVQKKGGSEPCSMTAQLTSALGYSMTVLPAEISFNTSYGMYYPTISATAASKTAPETVSLRLLDKDTGAELASVPIGVSVAEAANASTPSVKPHVCTKQNTTQCTAKELLALDQEPTFIEQNISDIYLLVGIIAGFALIVIVLFVLIPRK
jgi:hypothetical protein